MILSPTKSLVIFTAPRFGSTVVEEYFRHLLPSHQYLGEFLLPTSLVDYEQTMIEKTQPRPLVYDINEWRADVNKRVESIKCLTSPFIIKLFPESLNYSLNTLEFLTNNDYQIVILDRPNRLDAMLSLILARHKKVWHVTSVEDGVDEKIHFNANDFSTLIVTSFMCFDKLKDKVNDRAIATFVYDELQDNFLQFKQKMEKILPEELNERNQNFFPKIKKQHNNDHLSYFSNPEDVLKFWQKIKLVVE